MKTKTIYMPMVFLCLAAIGIPLQNMAQDPPPTHMTMLCGDNGSKVTGTATPLNLTGNVIVYSIGTGSNGAVIEVPVGLGTATRTFSVQNSNAEADLTISGIINGTPGILKLENGNLKLGGSNLYQDATSVWAGMLQLGASNVIPSNPLIMNGGTFSTGSPGMNETTSTLVLTENSTIELGTGSHILSFAASDAVAWTAGKMLTITGWQGGYDGSSGTQGQIFAGTDATGLTNSQLDQVLFYNGTNYFRSVILETGEVVADADMIATGTIAGSPFCAGSGGNAVPFVYDLAGNFSSATFTAQLSDALGSFTSPVNLQSVISDGSGSQVIVATIPTGTASGDGYRIRVVSNVPPVNGSDNGIDLTINALLSAVNITPGTTQNFCITGSGELLTAAETGGGAITDRQWGKRAASGGAITSIGGATGMTYTPTGADLGPGIWYVVCTSTPTCGSATVSNEVTVTVVQPPEAPVVTVADNCDGTSTLTASAFTGTLLWSTFETTTSITVSEAGLYTVTQTVDGCTSLAGSGTADPNTAPTAVISGNQSICIGGTANLSILFTGAAPFTYSINGGPAVLASSNPEIVPVSPSSNTIYTVTNVTDGNGCSNTGTGSATVYIGPVTTIPDLVVCPGYIDVPVTVAGFNDVGAISLVFNYDKDKLKFDSYDNTSGLIDYLVADETGAYGTIRISGIPVPPSNMGSGTLVTIRFEYFGGTTTLEWDDSDDVWCEYGSFDPEFIPFCDNPPENYYIDGTITQADEIDISCPTAVDLGACLPMADIQTAYNNWKAGFSYTGGLNASDNKALIPVLPTTADCTGADLSFTYTVTDDCGFKSCTSAFKVAAAPALVVTEPDDYSGSTCDYADQAAVDDAFALWLEGFSVTGGCDPEGDYGTPAAPLLSTGGTTTVTFEYSDLCESGSVEATFTITGSATSISGIIKYFNSPTFTPVLNATISLYQGGVPVYGPIPATGGAYTLTAVCPGTYEVRISKNAPVGSINATDAAQVNSWATASPKPSLEKVRFFAGDVIGNGVDPNNIVTSTDAQAIQLYFVTGGLAKFERTPWSFWKINDFTNTNPGAPYYGIIYPTIIVNPGDVSITQNFWGLVTGDINFSYIPLSKDYAYNLDLVYNENILLGAGMEFELPIRATSDIEVGAVSMILSFPSDLVEVTGVEMDNAGGNLDWAVNGDELRIGWNTQNPVSIAASADLVTLKLRTTGKFVIGETIRLSLAPDPLNELANGSYNVIPDAVLNIDVLEASSTGTWNPEPETRNNLELQCNPNPFYSYTDISYTLPYEGHVTLQVSDMIGHRVALVVDEQQTGGKYSMKLDALPLRPGIYTLTLNLDSSKGDLFKTIKLVRTQ